MPLYEVRVNGRLEPSAENVPGFRVIGSQLSTVLCARADSPADLTALLAEVHGQGLQVTEIHRVPEPRTGAELE